MDKQKKFAKTPLLYIHQPDISEPKAKMQSNYVTKKNNKEPEAPKLQKVTARPRQRDFFPKKSSDENEKKDSEPELEQPKEQTKDQTKDQTNKKFNEMSIQEKIDYFVHKPANIPRMKCEVKTANQSFRGTIRDVEEDQILMQVGRRTIVKKIAVEEIQDIRLLGF
ncbi:CotO family spore coat protein [Virgibacillus sp. DJP39]|uniref:CotO family spore coat protein n=1 Tax=Virgibacillus sp. DJP39 TaxID=3409790 RepID=UPI003BB7A5AE